MYCSYTKNSVLETYPCIDNSLPCTVACSKQDCDHSWKNARYQSIAVIVMRRMEVIIILPMTLEIYSFIGVLGFLQLIFYKYIYHYGSTQTYTKLKIYDHQTPKYSKGIWEWKEN